MEHLAGRMGVEALSTEAALAELERLLIADHPPVVSIAALDWRRLKSALPALAAPRYAGIAGTAAEAGGETVDLLRLLRDLSPEEVRGALIELVAEQVGAVLRIPAERLNTEMSVFELGMDSLMAMELRVAIEERFGIDLPAMAIAEGITISRLADRIRDRLVGVTQSSAADPVAEVLSRHSEEMAVDPQAIAARMADPQLPAQKPVGAARLSAE
jgi:acyl carrier protein